MTLPYVERLFLPSVTDTASPSFGQRVWTGILLYPAVCGEDKRTTMLARGLFVYSLSVPQLHIILRLLYPTSVQMFLSDVRAGFCTEVETDHCLETGLHFGPVTCQLCDLDG